MKYIMLQDEQNELKLHIKGDTYFDFNCFQNKIIHRIAFNVSQ